jgi:hypothetical protein
MTAQADTTTALDSTPPASRKLARKPHGIGPRQPTTGHDAGLYPRRGPFEILQKEPPGAGKQRTHYYLVGRLADKQPPQDWIAYLADLYGQGHFLIWWHPRDGEQAHGRIIVSEHAMERLERQRAAGARTPNTNPPPAPAPAPAPPPAQRHLELDPYDDDDDDDDDDAPAEGDDLADQLERHMRLSSVLKDYAAASNPPPPVIQPNVAADLAKQMLPAIMQMLQPVIARYMADAAKRPEPAPAPPAAPGIDPAWVEAIALMQAQGIDPQVIRDRFGSGPQAPTS